MKARHILGGIVGLIIIALWGITHALVCWTFTGEAFPNE